MLAESCARGHLDGTKNIRASERAKSQRCELQLRTEKTRQRARKSARPAKSEVALHQQETELEEEWVCCKRAKASGGVGVGFVAKGEAARGTGGGGGFAAMGVEVSSALAWIKSCAAGDTGVQIAWVVAVGVVGVLLLWTQRRSAQLRGIRGLPGGTMGFPLIGETVQYLIAHERFMTARRKRYGDVFKSHIFGWPTVISVNAEINKFVLQNEGKLFQANYPKSLTEVLGKYNMFKLDGSMHKKMRGIALGFLSTGMLKDHLLYDVEDYVAANLRTWKDRVVNVQDETRAMTFYLIAKQIISFTPGGETDVMKLNYYEFTEAFFSVPVDMPGTKYANGLKARANIVKTLSKVIDERRQQPLGAHTDVLSTILQTEKDDQDNVVYSTELIIDFLIGLLVAGHETTATAMMMSVKFLTDHPKILALLREEHKNIRDAKKPGERLTWEDYKKMSFTQNVINETLRLSNISHGVYRKALQDVEIKGYTVPKGWQILSYYRANHLDGSCYNDPLAFNPSRWQDKNESSNHFSPFGGGIRLCPGNELARLEITFFLHLLLTQYSWEPVGKDKLSYFPLVKMAKGYPLSVKSL